MPFVPSELGSCRTAPSERHAVQRRRCLITLPDALKPQRMMNGASAIGTLWRQFPRAQCAHSHGWFLRSSPIVATGGGGSRRRRLGGGALTIASGRSTIKDTRHVPHQGQCSWSRSEASEHVGR